MRDRPPEERGGRLTESVTVRLFRLQGDHYVEHATAKHGEVLRSDLPFPIEIATEDLVDF